MTTLIINTFLFFSLPGGSEIILIFLVILLLFGGKKIPELARGLGRGIREFNQAKATIKEEIEQGGEEESDKKKG